MGRIQSPAYADALIKASRSWKRSVREEAIFALGQLGLAEIAEGEAEPPELFSARAKAVKALLPRARGDALVIEALGKLAGPEAEEALLAALRHKDPAVRGEAALAFFRRRYLKRVPEYSTAAVNAVTAAFWDADPGVRWRAIYAFSRFPDVRAASSLARAAGTDGEVWSRVFALRALGQLKKAAPWEPMVVALNDPEPWVRREAAVALGQAGRADLILEAAYEDPSPHVRAAVADALMLSADAKLAYKLDALEIGDSPLVRGQHLLASAALRGQKAESLLAAGRKDPHWWVRSRAYLASAKLTGAREILMAGLSDPDLRVRAASLEAIAASTSAWAEGVVESVLNDPKAELELLGTAADAVLANPKARFYPALRAAMGTETARRFPELSDSLAKAAAAILRAESGLNEKPLQAPPRPPIVPSPHLGRETPPVSVVLKTEKGEIEILLEPREAPVHAACFLDNVRKGLYDGLILHRVVSGFVVQGGDPRGSGWGDAGFSLRDEINRLRYGRGVVGMPKAGKDTGGCQFFITHIPTPHLDGRYTVFGKVTRGLEVVDRLEPGDRILKAQVLGR